jgi:hypothetical protein
LYKDIIDVFIANNQYVYEARNMLNKEKQLQILLCELLSNNIINKIKISNTGLHIYNVFYNYSDKKNKLFKSISLFSCLSAGEIIKKEYKSWKS